jgi:glycosyltransferase involved in cell wall biosynthesis
MNNLKIIHVAPVYPPHLGGLEKVVRALALNQNKSGMEVLVITSDKGTKNIKIPKDYFRVKRLKSMSIANTIIMPKLLFELLKINKNSVVHVHVTQAYTPEMVWLASKIKRFKYVAHVHLDVPPTGPAGFLLKIYKPLVLKRVLSAASFVIVFTKDQRLNMHKKYGIELSKVRVIPNGVEEKFYYVKSRILHKIPRLLFVGRLSYQKNLPQLLRALEGVSDEFTTTLVGDGELELELRKLAKNLKLLNVNFVGRADGKKLINYYKNADIFVLPSEREGMPLVLLEAMAMGLPIVATNVTGNRDVVGNDKNGLLIPYNDTGALRQALLRIKSSKKMYEKMSKASRQMADKYSWDKISGAFLEVYKETAK